jgi:hypothetical protein
MWGSVVIFRRQKGSASKKFGNSGLCPLNEAVADKIHIKAVKKINA